MLIDCQECGRKVSQNATACPGCGHAFPRTSHLAFALRLITGTITIIAFLAGFAGDAPDLASRAVAGLLYAAGPAILYAATYVRGVA